MTLKSRQQEQNFGSIDLDKILSRLCGDRELLAELVEIYREDYPPLLVVVEQAIADRNGPAVQQSGHALKGLISNFLHNKTTSLALKIEKKGRCNDWAGIEEDFGQLKTASRQLIEALDKAIAN